MHRISALDRRVIVLGDNLITGSIGEARMAMRCRSRLSLSSPTFVPLDVACRQNLCFDIVDET
jgi:hypothetical protein